MDPERWTTIADLCQAALELAGEERAQFLDERCAGDDALRAEVEALLAGHNADPEFLEPSPTPERIDEVVGAWRLVRPLGEGGMGQVYLGERVDGTFAQSVAIKLLHPGVASRDILHRFRAERQILAQLQHPGIARVLDGGTTERGEPYLALEYVDGEPITEACDRRRLGIRERLEIFRQVCGAVEEAHRNLVVHRDLKPANILVTASGEPKLLDFGIAKLLGPHAHVDSMTLTRTDMRVLTPKYAAPEQVRGEAITTATDVYALGVLLHELLTGRLPYEFETPDVFELERKICDTDPTRPSLAALAPSADATAAERSRARGTTAERLRRQLTGDLDNIVLMALRKEPERRYASVAALSADIGRHLSGHPVLARPDTLFYRTRKFVGRNPLLSVAGVALVALVLGLVRATGALAQRGDELGEERETLEETLDFVLAVFGSADPYGDRGLDVTARELLEDAVQRVRTELSERNAVRARILGELGRVYLSLQEPVAAEALLDEALAIRAELDLPPDLREAELLDQRARARAGLNRLDDALADHERAAEVRDSAPGVAAEHRAAGLMQAARTHANRDRGHAEALALEALALLGEAGEASGVAVSTIWRTLAEWSLDAARFGESRERFARAAETLGADLPVDHPLRADLLTSLGELAADAGDTEAALRQHAEALAMRRRLFGDDHLAVAYSAKRVGNMAWARNDYRRAEELLREALAIYRDRLGDAHPLVADARVELAKPLSDTGQTEEAESLLRAALATSRAHPRARRPGPAQNLGVLLADRGDFGAAEELYYEALEAASPEHWLYGGILQNLSQLRHRQGLFEEAEQFAREALDNYRFVHGDERPFRVGSAEVDLARALRAQRGRGDFEEAEELLRRALPTVATLGLDSQRHVRCLFELAMLTGYTGRPAEALDLLRLFFEYGSDRPEFPHALAVSEFTKIADFRIAEVCPDGDCEEALALRAEVAALGG